MSDTPVETPHGPSFQGYPVEVFEPDLGLALADRYACALHLTDADLERARSARFDELDPPSVDQVFERRLGVLLGDPKLPALRALVLSDWGLRAPGHGASTLNEVPLVERLCERAASLGGLRHLYLGPFPTEPPAAPYRWLHELPRLLGALPDLETLALRVRGFSDLAPLRHAGLRALSLETAMPAASLLAWLCERVELPNLRRLTLWFNEDDGLDPQGWRAWWGLFLSGKPLPGLTHLGLRNAALADELAVGLAGAPRLGGLRSLDFSLGALTDVGGRALLESPASAGLERLDASRTYLSSSVLRAWEQRGVAVEAHEPRLLMRRSPARPYVTLRV
jgi:hypothetical protein